MDAPVLRDLHRRARRIYAEEIAGMIGEIAEALGGEPMKKSALAGDDTEPLEKGRTHKYLARFPTGNPKKPWRYVYEYRKSPWSGGAAVAVVPADPEKQIVVGAKFKDKAKDHGGHWEVTEVKKVEKTPEKGAHTLYTLKHDETGEPKTVAGHAYNAAEFIES